MSPGTRHETGLRSMARPANFRPAPRSEVRSVPGAGTGLPDCPYGASEGWGEDGGKEVMRFLVASAGRGDRLERPLQGMGLFTVRGTGRPGRAGRQDRKSTRLKHSHVAT